MEMREAYAALYALVEAKKADHFIFTSSGAEAVNHAVFAAYLDITRKTGKNHFVCGSIDEAPAIMSMSRCHELGCVHEMAPANREGVVTAKAVAEALTPRTAMVSISWANGLTGVVQPVAEIAEVCRERGVLFHVEATHVLGNGYFTLESSGADLLSFEGGLFIREGVEISPFIVGGNEQAHMRAGEVDQPRLAALGKEAEEKVRFRDHLCMETARLRDRFEELVGTPLFAKSERLPHISAHLFPGVTSDALLYVLERKGGRGSFGGNRLQHLQHILTACGIEEPFSHCGLSFQFNDRTTEAEVQQLAAWVLESVDFLCRCSKGVLV